MIGPLAQLHLSCMAIIFSIHKSINVLIDRMTSCIYYLIIIKINSQLHARIAILKLSNHVVLPIAKPFLVCPDVYCVNSLTNMHGQFVFFIRQKRIVVTPDITGKTSAAVDVLRLLGHAHNAHLYD